MIIKPKKPKYKPPKAEEKKFSSPSPLLEEAPSQEPVRAVKRGRKMFEDIEQEIQKEM